MDDASQRDERPAGSGCRRETVEGAVSFRFPFVSSSCSSSARARGTDGRTDGVWCFVNSSRLFDFDFSSCVGFFGRHDAAVAATTTTMDGRRRDARRGDGDDSR